MDILAGNISLNWIDFLLAGIFIFSLVVGTFKGLIKEIFSVVEWVGSIFLAYFFRLNLSSVLPLNYLNVAQKLGTLHSTCAYRVYSYPCG